MSDSTKPNNPANLMELWGAHTERQLPLKQQAGRLSELLMTNRKRLESTDYGGREVVVTPMAEFSHNGRHGGAYFFKDKEDAKRRLASISCYINIEGAAARSLKPELYRFDIDPDSGAAAIIDPVDGDDNFTNAVLLGASIDAMAYLFDLEAKKDKESRGRTLKKVATCMVTLAVSYGGYDGVEAIIHSHEASDRRAAAARVIFDKTGFEIPGTPAPVAPVSVGDISPSIFSTIPHYKKHDNLLSARRFNLTDQTCKTFATPVLKGESVVIATSKTDVIQDQRIVIGSDNQRDLVVCSTRTYPDSHQSWSLAIQLEKDNQQ